jgi:hypothetical protein
MAMVLEHRNVPPVAESMADELNEDLSSVLPVASQPGQDQFLLGQRSMVTNLALAQGWSFASLTVDPESPEPAISEVAQSSSPPATDAAVSLVPPVSLPEFLSSDTAEKQATTPEFSAQTSPPAGLLTNLIHEKDHHRLTIPTRHSGDTFFQRHAEPHVTQ